MSHGKKKPKNGTDDWDDAHKKENLAVILRIEHSPE